MTNEKAREIAREIALDLPMKYNLSFEERKALIRLVNISIAIDEIKVEIEETRKCPFRTNEEDEGLRIALQIIEKHIGGKE